MSLIDDSYVKSVLESDLYKLPLEEHKKEILKQIILLIFGIIFYTLSIIFILNTLTNKEFYIKMTKPFFIVITIVSLFFYFFLIKKHLLLLFKDYKTQSYEIVKDSLIKVYTTTTEVSKNNIVIISQFIMLEKSGNIKIGEFEEDLLYFRKRKRNPKKNMSILKEKTKSYIALPYSMANSIFEKFNLKSSTQEVFLIKSSGTKQIITILPIEKK